MAHILGILLMNSWNTDIFFSNTIICSLSALNFIIIQRSIVLIVIHIRIISNFQLIMPNDDD